MADMPGLSEASKNLYAECLRTARGHTEGFRKVFHQDELQKIGSSDLSTLLPLIHELSEFALFISLKQQGKVCWATRPRDAAIQVRKLNKEERMVYQVIEESHQEGVWIKKIKQKLGIFDNSVEKMVNKFMSMNLIKCVRHVKAPLQKTYMLFHLAPSDDVTGGSFYDQGDLDETMVDELSNIIMLHIRRSSWIEVKRSKAKKGRGRVVSFAENHSHAVNGASDPRNRTNKRKFDGDGAHDIESLPTPGNKKRQLRTAFDLEPDVSQLQVAFPAGHRYPTTHEIRKYIDDIGLLTSLSAQSLALEEVQQILDVLVWDEKLEKVNGGYRTVRGVRERPISGWSATDLEEQEQERVLGNGFTEAPCGRCPVIDLCGDGRPLSAEACLHYDNWLKMF